MAAVIIAKGVVILKRILAGLAVAILLSATAAVLPVLAGEVELPADPPARRTVSPVEKWRIGGEDDEDILLGLVTAALVGPDGNTYLLDTQLSQILVISPEGELITTLGREGDGPGELRRPHGLLLWDDHTLGVIQGFPGRITLLELDGTPAGTVTVGGEAEEGGFNFLNKAMLAADKIVAQKGRGSFDQKTSKSVSISTLSVLDRKGDELAQICTNKRETDFRHRVFDEARNFSEMNQWTLAPGGVIYTAPERDAYAVNAYDLDGKLQHTLRRPYTPRKRNDKDKKEITEGIAIIMNGRRLEVETRVLDTDPAIRGLHAAADDRLFITGSHDRPEDLPEGIGSRYEVISPTGEFLEELSLRIPGFDPEADRVMFLDGRSFLHMRNIKSATEAVRAAFTGGDKDDEEEDLDDAEPLEIVLYQLP